MTALQHLITTGKLTHVMDNNNVSLVTKENVERLRGIPILFISGGANVVFSPESTERSFALLTNTFEQNGYEREVFQGYGHLDCWMGQHAARDVYPTVYAHAAKIMGATKTKSGQTNGV
jgi:hypothetical protein